LAITGLVNKLLQAQAAEMHNDCPTFTPTFCRFLLWCMNCNITRAATLKGWRNILSDYNPALGLLSADEIAAIILLLQYSLDRQDAIIQDDRT
jgi:hypothetical protein